PANTPAAATADGPPRRPAAIRRIGVAASAARAPTPWLTLFAISSPRVGDGRRLRAISLMSSRCTRASLYRPQAAVRPRGAKIRIDPRDDVRVRGGDVLPFYRIDVDVVQLEGGVLSQPDGFPGPAADRLLKSALEELPIQVFASGLRLSP